MGDKFKECYELGEKVQSNYYLYSICINIIIKVVENEAYDHTVGWSWLMTFLSLKLSNLLKTLICTKALFSLFQKYCIKIVKMKEIWPTHIIPCLCGNWKEAL